MVLSAIVFADLAASANTNVFQPTVSGTLNAYGVATPGDMTVSAAPNGFEGAMEFASFNSSPYSSILLELTPSARPLTIGSIDLYGYGQADGQLTGSDYNEGDYLGTIAVPPGLLFNQYVTFDVTSFVQSTSGTFFGFNLRTSQTSPGDDSFTGTLVAAPEPSGLALAGLAGCVFFIKLKRLLAAEDWADKALKRRSKRK